MKLVKAFLTFVLVLTAISSASAFQDKDDDLLLYVVDYTAPRFTDMIPKVPEYQSSGNASAVSFPGVGNSYTVKGNQAVRNNSSGLPDSTRGSYTVRGNQLIPNNSVGLPDTTKGSYTIQGNQIVPNNSSGLPMGPTRRR
jgi:hypothetical protein